MEKKCNYFYHSVQTHGTKALQAVYGLNSVGSADGTEIKIGTENYKNWFRLQKDGGSGISS